MSIQSRVLIEIDAACCDVIRLKKFTAHTRDFEIEEMSQKSSHDVKSVLNDRVL